MTPDERPVSERQETDESLRAERQKVDQALAERLAATDETADAVIGRARARADDLRAARANAGQARSSAEVTPADRELRKERADADVFLKAERKAAALLATERAETDHDLQRERARADAAVSTRDEFLGIVSHDLRNLLNIMLAATAILAEDLARAEHAADQRAHLSRIQRAGARMNRVIGDLLDVASIEAGALAVTSDAGDPTQIIADAVDSFKILAAASEISLVAEPVPPGTQAIFDPARILQVLTNLLSNALKFTPAHGKVVVRVERINDEVRFCVADTGMGIPANKVEAVFERFLQINKDNRRGVGLGLYISKCIVHSHGGRIWAESEVGVGSSFYFTLPAESPPPPAGPVA